MTQPLTPQDQKLLAYWRRVREHYRRNLGAILRCPASEWALDIYAWDHDAGIRLTPIETSLWHDIRAEAAVLYPQFPVGRFFVDFANPVAKVAIECDGAKWHSDPAKDTARQAEIEALGWTVYRISGRDCHTDFTEHENPDSGRIWREPGPARLLIREVCARHGISLKKGGA
jgi:hypothetical protein